MTTPRGAYLAAASERFREAFALLEPRVRESFPGAEEVFEWKMPGWNVGARPAPTGKAGTVPAEVPVFVLLADRKGSVTLHVSDPTSCGSLEGRRSELTGSGFEVAKGCIRFQRPGRYPVEALAGLFGDLRRESRAASSPAGAAARSGSRRRPRAERPTGR